MRHLSDGVLRRLGDEPLAVPDRVAEHLDGCERCRGRREEIARDTELAARVLCHTAPTADLDVAWAGLRRELERPSQATTDTAAPLRAPRARMPRVSLRAAFAVGAIGVLVAGTAAAASLTTIFAPTHVAAVSVSQSEMRALAGLAGLADGRASGILGTPTGSTTLPFGRLTWTSQPPKVAASVAEASADAGYAAILPSRLPAGVSAAPRLGVESRVRATVAFNERASGVAGSSVTLEAGPTVVAEYKGSTGSQVPALAVATMRRPVARSTGASLSAIEAFLLNQPGIPAALSEEIRLLGDLRTTLPIPVPAGASVRSVSIDGWPGILLADRSGVATGVIWEDGHGLLHAVVGILDAQDVLGVARQVG